MTKMKQKNASNTIEKMNIKLTKKKEDCRSDAKSRVHSDTPSRGLVRTLARLLSLAKSLFGYKQV